MNVEKRMKKINKAVEQGDFEASRDLVNKMLEDFVLEVRRESDDLDAVFLADEIVTALDWNPNDDKMSETRKWEIENGMSYKSYKEYKECKENE